MNNRPGLNRKNLSIISKKRFRTKINKNVFSTNLPALTVSTSSASFTAAYPSIDKEQHQTGVPASVKFSQVVESKPVVIAKNMADAPLIIRLL